MKNKRAEKKRVLICVIVLIAAMICTACSGAVASDKSAHVFVSNGLSTYVDGVKVTIPGQKEHRKFMDSFDEETGRPTYEYSYDTPGYEQKTVEMDFDYGGREADFLFSVVEKGEKKIPIYKPLCGSGDGTNQPLTRIGDSNRFVMEFKGSVYMVDLDEERIIDFLAGESDGVTIDTVLDAHMNWACHPRPSPDGSLLIYQTDRCFFSELYPHAPALMLYDFETGSERVLAYDCCNGGPVAWNGTESIFFCNYLNFVEVNLSESRQAEVICSTDGSISAAFYPYVVLPTADGIQLFNCETRIFSSLKDIPLYSEEPLRFGWAVFNNEADKPLLATYKFTFEKTAYYLLDPVSFRFTEIFSIDGEFRPASSAWVDGGTMAISGTGPKGEKTYLIDVSDVF